LVEERRTLPEEAGVGGLRKTHCRTICIIATPRSLDPLHEAGSVLSPRAGLFPPPGGHDPADTPEDTAAGQSGLPGERAALPQTPERVEDPAPLLQQCDHAATPCAMMCS